MKPLTRDDLAHLVGARVRVHLANVPDSTAVVEGVLRFLPPPDRAVLADVVTGVETTFHLPRFVDVEDARLPCAACPPGNSRNLHNNLFETREDPPRRLCANHYRNWAQAQPAPITPCPDCDTGAQAFYSPGDKRFCCAQCHVKTGRMTGLSPEVQAMREQAADCRAQDLEDRRHRWFHVRGLRYHCKKCGAKRFTEPPQGTLASR
jgi:hypothetical protein